MPDDEDVDGTAERTPAPARTRFLLESPAEFQQEPGSWEIAGPEVDRLVAAALLGGDPADLLDRAAAAATTSRARQLVAIAAAHLDGDADRCDALVRDHLADHPNDRLAGWIAAQHF